MNRSFRLIIGEMRSGKSYLANRLAKNYIGQGGSALFYNLGKPSDFEVASPIVIKNRGEHLRLIKDKEQRQEFNLDGELWRYQEPKKPSKSDKDLRLFPYDWTGRAAKTARLEPASERMLFDTIYDYFANSLIILDDCRAMFRHGLSAEAITLFSRINHTGGKSPWVGYRGAGCDVIAITHDPGETCVDEMMTYATDICLFKTAKEPEFKAIRNAYIRQRYEKYYPQLAAAPKYSFLHINPVTDKTAIFTP